MARAKRRAATAAKIDAAPAPIPAPRSSWPFALPGSLSIAAGAALLVYPCFLTRSEVSALFETASYLPLVAVAMVFAGIALSIAGLQRQGSSEPPFSEVEEAKYAGWWPRIRLVLPPLIVYYLPIYLWESWAELDREAARERDARVAAGKTGYDWGPIVALLVGAVCLTLMEYYGHGPHLHQLVNHFDPDWRTRIGEPETFWATLRASPFFGTPHEEGLTGFLWWSGWRVLGFFIIPALVIKLVLRGRLADYGLATAGFLKHAWIYVAFFLLVLGSVLVVSYDESFNSYYPFYKLATRSWYDFWAWELLYAAQFFSLEFFFRGFWLKAAKRSMGSHAIYAMVVPYCMIHFGKPFLETLAAIVAGVVLGTLALRTRSIWSGFLIHVSVAVSMDLAALAQTTGLPDRWWPVL